MTPLAVSGYEISLVLHITAVVIGLGSTFVESIAFPIALRMDKRHLPYVHRLQLAINSWVASPALAVILLTGLYQASDADYDLDAVWLSGSFLIVFALGGLLGGYFVPADRKLGAMVEREIAAAGDGEVVLSDEYQAAARREGAAGGLAGLLVVVAIYLMVVKPGL